MYKLKRSPVELLARPGTETHYTVVAAARLLRVNKFVILDGIEAGWIRAKRYPTKSARRWSVPRSEIIKLAREIYADRPIRLARILAGPKARLLVLSNDRRLRETLKSHNPVYAGSVFSLGQMTSVIPSNTIVIDWETSGSGAAKDIADRLSAFPDRPKLVGILPLDETEKTRGWDLIIPRPYKPKDLLSSLRKIL